MAHRLTVGVAVRHPDSGDPVFLPAGSELPDWAAGLVGDHALTPADTGEWQAPTGAVATEPAATADGPPPKAGQGSSRARWLAYATANGVDVDEDTSRDDIIAACQAANVPVD